MHYKKCTTKNALQAIRAVFFPYKWGGWAYDEVILQCIKNALQKYYVQSVFKFTIIRLTTKESEQLLAVARDTGSTFESGAQ